MFNNYAQPYFNYRPQPQPQQPQVDPYMQQYMKPQGLQGKTVDSIEVVKATDIPLDYSTSYFPLVDGTAIVTKQLMQDGTSKIVVYKPADIKAEETPKYVTADEFKKFTQSYEPTGIKDLKDEVKELKKKLREITNELEDKKGE